MIRKLIARFYRSAAERRAAPRYNFQTPLKIWIETAATFGKSGNNRAPSEPPVIWGETKDLSAAGIGFFVPSIRIRESYLVGENSTLNAELDLPEGKVRMRITARRYEQASENQTVLRYLIGASILQITREDREIYERFLRSKGNNKKIAADAETETKESRSVLETI